MIIKRTIIALALLVFPLAASCQSSESNISDADKAKAYFDDGVACYKRLDFLCAMNLLEQVWYLDDYSRVDKALWVYYTAQSNFMVAIDDESILPIPSRIHAAERGDELYRMIGGDFYEKRLLLQYYIIKSIDDDCDDRKVAAVERFQKTSAATKDDEFAEVKTIANELLSGAPTCSE